MRISVFTPTNNTKWLNQLYDSLVEQTHIDWEWVVVPNHGVKVDLPEDPRIKIVPIPFDTIRIGALKNFACSHASGEIYLECDHDDVLTPDCLWEVNNAFVNDPDATMVHSNDCHANELLTHPAQIWSKYYGWTYRPFEYKGAKLLENISPEAIPQNISRIWFAPDHVRAWRATTYWAIGGHDQSMQVSDDHDIVARNYLQGKIIHIDKCLYIYRVHGKNATFEWNKMIQETMWDNYDKYVILLCSEWATQNELLKVDLGGAIRPQQGYITCDINTPCDVKADLNERWPFEDNSVGVFRAVDLVEHLRDPIHTMNEAYRCLAHGGFFMIEVPSTDGRGAFQDPTHVSFWNENSFWYYTSKPMQEFIKFKANCQYQAMRIMTKFPNDQCKQQNIPYAYAHLIAVKDGKRFYGSYNW